MAGREGYGDNPTVTKNKTMPTHHLERDHILYQDLAVTEAKLIQQYEEKPSTLPKCKRHCSVSITADSL